MINILLTLLKQLSPHKALELFSTPPDASAAGNCCQQASIAKTNLFVFLGLLHWAELGVGYFILHTMRLLA